MQKNNPAISIIIPCYNHGAYLMEAIDSVLASTLQDFEIIVVDDGSDEVKTINILSEIDSSRTRVIHQENRGLSAARNAGISLSSGKYILCLDADDMITPTLLEKSFHVLENCPEAGVVATPPQHFGDQNYIWRPIPFSFYQLLRENLLHASCLFRRDIWKAVGGYDENMRTGCEDWEFWIRVAKAGWKFARIDEPLFLYRKDGQSMVSETQKRRHEIFSYIQRKHPDLYAPSKQIAMFKQWFLDTLKAGEYVILLTGLLRCTLPYRLRAAMFDLCQMVCRMGGKKGSI
ncbi:MAG TPA: glycosyltransferase family 2 protein [Candidatus Marinimicrobia bacterium]|nr:glycosyltransferase family 2 protein [Candidatus Neomarinimicrobiota bacterium]